MFNDIHISNKIMFAALFGVAILLFGVWKSPLLQTDTKRPTSKITTATSSTNILKSDKYTKDSDGDGVSNWEEVLLGLNPNKKDSNGDGIPDGEEVIKARKAFAEKVNNASTTASTTQTDTLTRQIFGAYIQSKQLGTYDKKSFDFLIAQATNSQFKANISSSYTLQDILTTNNTSKARTSQYETDFQNAIEPVINIKEYELTTYGRAVQTGDPKEFAVLIKDAEAYQKVAQTLLKIRVPKDVAKAHLDLINSFSTFAKILKVMGNSSDDPLRSLIATRDFIKGEDAIKTAYSQIGIYFTLKDINS